MPACMNLCGRQDDQAIVKERCILCGENKCSGCNALLQKDYRHGVSERRTRHRAGHSSEASDEAGSHRDMPDLSGTRDSCRHQKSKGSMRASVKKDACFYSQGTVSSEQDGDGESESGHERVAPRHQRLQVWFREPNICRQKEKGVMLVPGEYTEYEFVLQWGERRWAVRRRYREFSALDRALDETLPESVQLPEFPPKVRTRRHELEKYLRAILRDADISVLDQVRLFCKMPEGCNEAEKVVPWEQWKQQREEHRTQQG